MDVHDLQISCGIEMLGVLIEHIICVFIDRQKSFFALVVYVSCVFRKLQDVLMVIDLNIANFKFLTWELVLD